MHWMVSSQTVFIHFGDYPDHILFWFLGIVLLIQHTERKSFPSSLDSVLNRQFTRDDENQLIVKIAEHNYTVHSNFRLFISINTPLYLVGDETYRLNIGHSNVIDLTMSQRNRVNRLMTDIMRLEKPDYEAQAHSLQGGILHHKQELDAEHVSSFSGELMVGSN